MGLPGGSDEKESACSAGDLGSIPGLGRSLGEGNGYPLQYSCLENSIDRGPWQLQSMGSQSQTWLSNYHFYFLKVLCNLTSAHPSSSIPLPPWPTTPSGSTLLIMTMILTLLSFIAVCKTIFHKFSEISYKIFYTFIILRFRHLQNLSRITQLISQVANETQTQAHLILKLFVLCHMNTEILAVLRMSHALYTLPSSLQSLFLQPLILFPFFDWLPDCYSCHKVCLKYCIGLPLWPSW